MNEEKVRNFILKCYEDYMSGSIDSMDKSLDEYVPKICSLFPTVEAKVNEPAHNIHDLMYLTAFQHRRAVELGNRETDLELRKRYSEYVELLNKALRQLEPNYASIHVDKPIMVKEICPVCGQEHSVIKGDNDE